MSERLNGYVCAMCIDDKTGLPMPKLFVGDGECTAVDGYNTAMVLDNETGKPMQKVRIMGIDLPMMENAINDHTESIDAMWKTVISTSSRVEALTKSLQTLVQRLDDLEQQVEELKTTG